MSEYKSNHQMTSHCNFILRHSVQRIREKFINCMKLSYRKYNHILFCILPKKWVSVSHVFLKVKVSGDASNSKYFCRQNLISLMVFLYVTT